jgi:GNAT superfamily N-acetyltransferase
LAGTSEAAPKLAETLAFLLPLSRDYPHLNRWYRTKVTPGLLDGSRLLITVEREGQIVGVGIAKREATERKICTVRVSPNYVGRGIGLRLFDQLLRWVDTDRPHLTVSERNVTAFERIFDWYGFRLTSIKEDYYIPKVSEFAYNEAFAGKLSSPGESVLTRTCSDQIGD